MDDDIFLLLDEYCDMKNKFYNEFKLLVDKLDNISDKESSEFYNLKLIIQKDYYNFLNCNNINDIIDYIKYLMNSY